MNPLPYNKEAESSLIGSILTDPEVHDLVFSTIKYENLINPTNRLIFDKCLKLYMANEKIDPIRMEGQESYAINLASRYGYKSSQIDVFISEILEDFKKRRIIFLVGSVNDLLEQGKSPNECIEFLRNQMDDIIGYDNQKIYYLNDLIDEFSSQDFFDSINSSVLTTDLDIDRTVKFKAGDMCVIAGRPSMGKTALALVMAKNIARHKQPVAFFSLEMRAQYLLKRLAQGEGRNLGGYEGFKRGCERLIGLPIYIDDASKHNLAGLKNRISGVVKKYNVQTVFIDYLTLLDMPPGQNRNQQVEEISRSIKIMAKHFNIPIIVLSQLSRAVEQRTNKNPSLSDLRESGAIEQDADQVLLLFRPFKYGMIKDKSGTDLTNYLEVIVAKNRDGQTGTIKLFYDEKSQSIENWADPKYNKIAPLINEITPEPIENEEKLPF